MANPPIIEPIHLPKTPVVSEDQVDYVNLAPAITAAELDALERLLGEDLIRLLAR